MTIALGKRQCGSRAAAARGLLPLRCCHALGRGHELVIGEVVGMEQHCRLLGVARRDYRGGLSLETFCWGDVVLCLTALGGGGRRGDVRVCWRLCH